MAAGARGRARSGDGPRRRSSGHSSRSRGSTSRGSTRSAITATARWRTSLREMGRHCRCGSGGSSGRTSTIRLGDPDARTPSSASMGLLEVGKGCGRGCRFCMEGEIYRPVRHRHIPAILRAAETAMQHGQRIGLVGACVSDYPWIDDLVAALRAKGADISLSSVRADSLSPGLVQGLLESGTQTLTIAPEAGTERLRDRDSQESERPAPVRGDRPDRRLGRPAGEALLHDRPADRDGGGHRRASSIWPRRRGTAS